MSESEIDVVKESQSCRSCKQPTTWRVNGEPMCPLCCKEKGVIEWIRKEPHES